MGVAQNAGRLVMRSLFGCQPNESPDLCLNPLVLYFCLPSFCLRLRVLGFGKKIADKIRKKSTNQGILRPCSQTLESHSHDLHLQEIGYVRTAKTGKNVREIGHFRRWRAFRLDAAAEISTEEFDAKACGNGKLRPNYQRRPVPLIWRSMVGSLLKR